jgi:hypothetical protein
MHFCIESMWSHNKAWNHGMWNSTATTKDHQVHHGAAVLQIGTPSYSTLFLRVPSIITQSTTLQCLLLDCSSNKSSKKRWKWPPWLYEQCHKLTPTNVTGMRVSHTTLPKTYNCQSDVSKYDPLDQDLGGQSDGIYTHCHMMLSMRRKENHPSAMTILICLLTAATIATNRTYTACTGLLPVANNIRAQMTHS